LTKKSRQGQKSRGGSTASRYKAKTIIALVLLGVVATVGYLLYPNSASPAVGLSIGSVAPDFKLRDTESRTVTREALKGKPTFIFFTTSWCVPCQDGAKQLLKYDLETGGNTFHVLIVFVDPRETEQQLREWKNSFSGKDWFAALDRSGMASVYQVKYLDTKYVLDRNGVIRWTDIYPLAYEGAKKALQSLIG